MQRSLTRAGRELDVAGLTPSMAWLMGGARCTSSGKRGSQVHDDRRVGLIDFDHDKYDWARGRSNQEGVAAERVVLPRSRPAPRPTDETAAGARPFAGRTWLVSPLLANPTRSPDRPSGSSRSSAVPASSQDDLARLRDVAAAGSDIARPLRKRVFAPPFSAVCACLLMSTAMPEDGLDQHGGQAIDSSSSSNRHDRDISARPSPASVYRRRTLSCGQLR